MVLTYLLPPALEPQCLPTSEVRKVGNIVFMGAGREGNDHLLFFGLFKNKQNFSETL